jgi:hypothetical protein
LVVEEISTWSSGVDMEAIDIQEEDSFKECALIRNKYSVQALPIEIVYFDYA